jgi:hypothetical protein
MIGREIFDYRRFNRIPCRLEIIFFCFHNDKRDFDMLNAVDLLNPSASKILFRLLMYRRMNPTPPAAPSPMREFSTPPIASAFITDPELGKLCPDEDRRRRKP